MNYIKRLLEINQNTLLSDSSIFITVRLSRVIQQSFKVYSPFNQICEESLPGTHGRKCVLTNKIHFHGFRISWYVFGRVDQFKNFGFISAQTSDEISFLSIQENRTKILGGFQNPGFDWVDFCLMIEGRTPDGKSFLRFWYSRYFSTFWYPSRMFKIFTEILVRGRLTGRTLPVACS